MNRIFRVGDFVIFGEYRGVITETFNINQRQTDLYQHVINVKGIEILCYNYLLKYDIDKSRLEKIKKLKLKI